MQEAAYRDLLNAVPALGHGQRALDVGCGGGRWCRILARAGFAEVVGIDLQAALIESDRQRMPELRFEVAALQEFEDREGFDLVSSVTVIQHNPFEHHHPLAAKMRSLTRDGGHVIMLENVRDRSSYMFAHPTEEWVALFSDAGFELVALRPYDFSPLLRAVLWTRGAVTRFRGRSPAKENPGRPGAPGSPSRAHDALMAALRAAIAVDAPLERFFARHPDGRSSIHCGFLFRAA
jgi:SAM-dependent methyltransferase